MIATESIAQMLGRPVYVSEVLQFGEAIVADVDAFRLNTYAETVHVDDVPPIVRAIRDAKSALAHNDLVIFIHPHTFHALRISIRDYRRMSDPAVQLEASLAWIRDRAERSAAAAVRRLDAMLEHYAAVDDIRDELRRNDGCQHTWWTIVLPQVVECARCRTRCTVDIAAELGLVVA